VRDGNARGGDIAKRLLELAAAVVWLADALTTQRVLIPRSHSPSYVPRVPPSLTNQRRFYPSIQ
jgi:hypothetical protein